MSEVLIPYAKLIDSGRLVTIDEVESGLACNCICDGCGAPMVARKGQEKAHHFSHAPRSTNEDKPCTFNFKRGCFWLIRQILEESVGTEIALPDYELSLKNIFAQHERLYHVTKASTPVYQQLCVFELSSNSDIAAAILTIGEHKLRMVFGFPKFFKKPVMTGDGCAEVFVSLANVYDAYSKEKQPFIKVIKAHIFSPQYKEWVFHPRQVKCELDFAAVCDDLIVASRQRSPVNYKPLRGNIPLHSVLPERQYVVVKPRTESIISKVQDVLKFNARLEAMVKAADTLYNVLKQSSAKHCDKCQFLYMATGSKCPICGEYTSTNIQLDAHYMHNLAQKYRAVGYVELSLKNHPS